MNHMKQKSVLETSKVNQQLANQRKQELKSQYMEEKQIGKVFEDLERQQI